MIAGRPRGPQARAGWARAGWISVGALIGLTLAGCGGGTSSLSYLPPPDPPPIPLRKPEVPPGALTAPRPPAAPSLKSPWRPPAVAKAPLAPRAPLVSPARTAPERPMAFAYVVQPGDTVYGVSRKLGVPLREVIDANALAPPYTLSLSQTLRIPNPRRHTVRRGETVYGISRGYGVEMTELVRLNGIEPPYTIAPGARLVLPAAPGEPTAGAALAAQAAPAAREPGKLDPPAKTAARAVQKAAVRTPAPVSAPVSAPVAPRAPAPAAKPARLAAIPQPPPRAGGNFLWPAEGRLLATYGPKQGGLHNDGINIAAPRGAPVRAAENGVVVYSGNELRGFGNLILIKHADGWVTAYAHTEQIRVARGQQVRRGQTIATVGSSGNVSRPQLHFEIRKGARAVDPRRLLGKKSA